MIETHTVVCIDVGIDDVWEYVRDIGRWAKVFPGCRSCEVIDAHRSRWVIKVGAGGLIRTVNVDVQVDEWAGPEHVQFSYKLVGDPVEGSGAYRATKKSATQTEIALHVRVAGQGALAPMWEAMSRPLLPQLAKTFALQLKAEIEKTADVATRPIGADSHAMLAAVRRRARNLWRRFAMLKNQRPSID